MGTSSLRGSGGVFINYRREDTAATARHLYDRLGDRFGENRVFMDVGSIPMGVDFTRALRDALSKCDILLALIGRNWLTAIDDKKRRRLEKPDDYVRVEVETALQRGIRIVPVLVEGAALPQAGDLPPSLQPLALRQALQLSHAGFQYEVARLITAIDEVIGAEPGRSWNLELVVDKYTQKTFRLSSGEEAHDIVVRRAGGPITIRVDGIPVISEVSQNLSGRQYRLDTLSSTLGSDVYITVTFGFWDFKSLVLIVGDQVVTYGQGIK